MSLLKVFLARQLRCLIGGLFLLMQNSAILCDRKWLNRDEARLEQRKNWDAGDEEVRNRLINRVAALNAMMIRTDYQISLSAH